MADPTEEPQRRNFGPPEKKGNLVTPGNYVVIITFY
jgi:hypothetical protein